ncbi:hypothetical protein ID866_9391 [Astraeus odoratus]|nr:hypothetical protein ID866_9391 [Astraeus odoratus]
MLLDAGCPIDLCDSQQRTPLLAAIIHGLIPVIQLLITHGANLAVVDNMGRSALDLCLDANTKLKEETRLEVIQLLLDAGCPANVQNVYGETPLHLAVAGGLTSIAYHLFTTYGVDATAVDNNGRSALHLCLDTSSYILTSLRYEFVRLFIDAGCDCLLPDRNGDTPLRLAIQHQDPRIVSYLLGVGASLYDVQDLWSLDLQWAAAEYWYTSAIIVVEAQWQEKWATTIANEGEWITRTLCCIIYPEVLVLRWCYWCY